MAGETKTRCHPPAGPGTTGTWTRRRRCAFVSGALGAALLAAGEARANNECGAATQSTITCSNAAYSDGIFYGGSTPLQGYQTINVPGSSTATTITAGATQAVGVYLYTGTDSGRWINFNMGGETDGTAHVVNVVQGTNTVTGADRNNGVYFRVRIQIGSTGVDLKRGVTIGSATAPMKQHGVSIRLTGASSWGTGAAAIASAATIFAAKKGILVQRTPSNTAEATTITNSGAISSGEEGIFLWYNSVSEPYPGAPVATYTGGATITNTGAVTVSGAKYGIRMEYLGRGAVEIDNAGTIAAATGSGIQLAANHDLVAAATLTNSGRIDAATLGLRLSKRNGSGAMTLTNSGAVTVTADAASGVGHAIWLTEGAAASGAVTITNRGDLRSKNHALFADMSDTANPDPLSLTNSAAVASEDADGIRIDRFKGTGAVTVTNRGGVSGRSHGIYVGSGGRIDFDQTAGTISGRTGVYLGVSRASAMDEMRSEDDDGNHVPAIDVAWTGGSVARGTAANDRGRFRAASVAAALSLDREAAAVKAVAETVRWGAAAGIEAHALSWRDAAEEAAKGDDPGAFANAAAQTAAVPTGATAGDNAYVAAFRAALGNEDLAVAAAVLTAIDSTATSLDDVSDAEIVTYLGNAANRTLLRNILSQGLSDGEKAVLRAVATGDAAALTTALDDADAGFSNDYKTAVRALLDRYNVDDVRVAMTAGSIDSRGDGIRAYYATPHDMNGGIRVDVAEGASVTGGLAGVYVANAGPGLMLARKYTYGYAPGDAATADDLVAAMHGEGAAAVPLRNQLVTVAGTVTGGTDAAVHLNGGGAVLVMEGGRVRAGASGVGILVNDPGPAHLFIDGEVKGGAGGAAAAHLTGGGSVVVGVDGRVQANGAAHAIRGGGDETTMVALTLAAARPMPYREDVNAQVEGSVEGVKAVVRVREYRDGVFTGYATSLTVTDGVLDTGGLPLRPCPEGWTRGTDDGCVPPPPDTGMDRIDVKYGKGGIESRDDGIRVEYATPRDDNDAISITVPEGASVTGSMAGVYVANAGTGLMLARKYTPGFAEGDDPDELVAAMHGEGTDAVPLRNQLVTVAGTVTGGTDAAVHLNGGGAVLVLEGGSVRAGASGVGILVNDPGPALVYVDGEVKGGAGGAAAAHLTGGGSVIVGLNGRVEANGADHAIRGGGDETTMVTVTLVTGGIVMYREDAEEAHARVKGSLADVDKVRFREDDRNGVPTGYSRTLAVTANGMLDTRDLPPRPAFSCEDVEKDGDRRCRLYEALPSMLLAMNGLPSYAERTAAARDGNGAWARVEAARGEWRARKATTAEGLAYDHSRGAGHAGVDFAVGERVRGGVSAHAVGGAAEMSGVGEVDLKGWGAGVSATWLAGGLYVDAQAAATVYDVDVKSRTHGKMSKQSVHGMGYALGVDVGARMPVGAAFATPRAGLAWSKADLSDFTDMELYGNDDMRARVSVADASSVKGRLGVTLEAEAGPGRLFGSLDVEGELSDETEVAVGVETLKTKVRPTTARLGVGGVFDVDENVRLRATADYRTSGGGMSGYGGALELQVRF